jgi:hypothetical protein
MAAAPRPAPPEMPGEAQAPISLRDTSPLDAPTLVRFAYMAFDAGWTEAFVHWKYFQNPAGRIYGQCAEIAGRPAAYYGNTPVRLKIGDQVVVAAQAVDAMVAPEARRRGLFVTLARETYRQMDEAGVALTYAFPNPVSLVAFVERLGWAPVGEVPRYVRVLDAQGAARAAGRVGPAGWLYARWLGALSRPGLRREAALASGLPVRVVETPDERFDGLWAEASRSFPIAVVRDAAYLRWRYVEHPAAPYLVLAAERGGRLAGFAVLSSRDARRAGVVALTELLVAPGDREAGLALLAECVRRARQAGGAQLQCWLLPHHAFYRELLERSGLVFRPARYAPGLIRYTTPHIIRAHPAGSLSPDPALAENWYLSAGDYDYY